MKSARLTTELGERANVEMTGSAVWKKLKIRKRSSLLDGLGRQVRAVVAKRAISKVFVFLVVFLNKVMTDYHTHSFFK